VSEIGIAIGCTQRFDIAVTPELIALLTKLGNMHYDGVCKSAVNCGVGGFIYGWSNRMDYVREAGKELSFVDSLTNRTLQICLKICEFPPPRLTPEEFATRNQFFRLGFAALRQAGADERFALTIPVGAPS